MAREVVSVESRIEQVTDYASGARVRRVASLRAPLPAVVRFARLPLTVIDDTVRSEASGYVSRADIGFVAPNESFYLTLEYKVKSQRDVAMV